MKNTQEKKQKKLPNSNGKKSVYNDSKTGQFVEGNPGGGRPLGSKNFATDFDEVVEEIAKANNISTSDARKILIKKAYSEAKSGQFPFYKDIMDRYYGKAQDNIKVVADVTISEVLNNLENGQTSRRQNMENKSPVQDTEQG